MAVAAILRFVFPPALESHSWKLWSHGYDDFANLQFGLISALAIGILIHLMLHWSWICGLLATKLGRDKKAKIDDGLQTIYGVGLLIVVLTAIGMVVAAAQLSIRSPQSTSSMTENEDRPVFISTQHKTGRPAPVFGDSPRP